MAGKKRIVKDCRGASLAELLPQFVAAQTAKGVSEKTIQSYYGHFHCIRLHLDTTKPVGELTKKDLENLIIALRRKGLSPNSISSYSRVLRTMLNWCREMGYTDLLMPPIVAARLVNLRGIPLAETMSADALIAQVITDDSNGESESTLLRQS